MSDFRSIAVVGAGAIGGAIAFALAEAGFAPRLLARGATLAAIRRDGLRVERPAGEGAGGGTVRLAATDDAASLGPQDLVIGTLKAQDWPAALPGLRPLIGPHTVILPAINGAPWWYCDGIDGRLAGRPIAAVDPDGALLAALPAAQVIGTVVYMGAARTAPNVVDWSSGRTLVIGEARGANRARTEGVAALLRRAGFTIMLSDDIRGAIWAKLLGNAAFNPISVIADALIDEIMGDPGLARLTLETMTEVAEVAAAIGAPSTIPVPERYAMTAELGAFRTSMLQDFHAGRALELGGLVDAVAELGAALGIATPLTRTLAALARRAVTLRDRKHHL